MLFAFQGDVAFLEYITLIISKAFHHINKFFLLNEKIEGNILEEEEIDLLVTNYPYSLGKQPILKTELSNVPTVRELEQLQHDITTLNKAENSEYSL